MSWNGVRPRWPQGELTGLPGYPSWIYGGYFQGRERKRKVGKVRKVGRGRNGMDGVETGDGRWMRGRGKGKSWGKGKGRAGVVHVPANENIYDLI